MLVPFNNRALTLSTLCSHYPFHPPPITWRCCYSFRHSHIYILSYASWSLVGLFLFVKFYFTNVRLYHVILYLVYHPDLAREMLDVFPVQPLHKGESNDPPRSVRLVHESEGFWRTGPLTVRWCIVYQWLFSWSNTVCFCDWGDFHVSWHSAW